MHLNIDMLFSDIGLCSLSRFVLMCCNNSENKSMIFYSITYYGITWVSSITRPGCRAQSMLTVI